MIFHATMTKLPQPLWTLCVVLLHGQRAKKPTLSDCGDRMDLMIQTAMAFRLFAEISVLHGLVLLQDGPGGTCNRLLQRLLDPG